MALNTSTTVTKILPQEKRIWVKTISRSYFDNLKENGWKIYSFSDVQGKYNLEVNNVSILEAVDADS